MREQEEILSAIETQLALINQSIQFNTQVLRVLDATIEARERTAYRSNAFRGIAEGLFCIFLISGGVFTLVNALLRATGH